MRDIINRVVRTSVDDYVGRNRLNRGAWFQTNNPIVQLLSTFTSYSANQRNLVDSVSTTMDAWTGASNPAVRNVSLAKVHKLVKNNKISELKALGFTDR
ncbi:hypothetical protein RZS08_50765, partial [Arthrospira platensis SPKY1]|nr:hypothetical protein [Arthrospira platensis SPKY1]